MEQTDELSISDFLKKNCHTCLKEFTDLYTLDAIPASTLRLLRKNISCRKYREQIPSQLCFSCYDILDNFEKFCVKALKNLRSLQRSLSKSNRAIGLDEDKIDLKKSELVSSGEETVNTSKKTDCDDQHKVLGDFTLERINDSPLFRAEDEDHNVVQDFEEIFFESDSNNVYENDLSEQLPSESYNKEEKVKNNFKGRRNKLSKEVEDSTVENALDKKLSYNDSNKVNENDLSEQLPSESCNKEEKVKNNFKRRRNKLSKKVEDSTVENALDKKLSYNCSDCGRKYGYGSHFSKHLSQHHNREIKKTPCAHKSCKKIFQHEETAKQHYQIQHVLTVKKKYGRKVTPCLCDICGRICKSLVKLKEHRYQHEPMEARPFICQQCGKRFCAKHLLTAHLLRHAGTKKVQCPYCDMKKNCTRDLREHINTHTKEKQYKCPLCPRVFEKILNLQFHDRVVHKKIKRYKCKYCDQSFGKSDNMRRHEMQHTGERPHKCDLCERSFIQKVSLIDHLKKAHGKKDK